MSGRDDDDERYRPHDYSHGTPLSPRRVMSWIIQVIGFIVFIGLGILGRFDHPRVNLVYCFVGFILIGWGRAIYLPEVKLMKSCPYCAQWIRVVNTVCPHCGRDLHVSSRFSGG